jgi:predicted metalloendopeptidase
MKPSNTLIAILLWMLAGTGAGAQTPQEVADTVLQTMDQTADPCSDFYTYACGGWLLDHAELQAGKSRLERGYDLAADDVRGKLYLLMQELAANPGTDPARQRIGELYGSCMDEAKIEADGLAGLASRLADIDSVTDRDRFLRVAGELTRAGVPTIFQPVVVANYVVVPAQSRYVLFTYAGDLGYPDGDVYRHSGRLNRALRGQLQSYIREVLDQLDDPDARTHAKQILAIESVVARYHPRYGKPGRLGAIVVSSLNQIPSVLNWGRYAEGLVALPSWQLVMDRDYLNAIGRVLTKYPVATLKAYLQWRLISANRRHLARDFQGTVAATLGAVGVRPRWQECVDTTSELLPDDVGKLLIVSEGLDQAGDARMELVRTILGQVETTLGQRINEAGWLKDTASRTAVADKLQLAVALIGFPQPWSGETGWQFAEPSFLGKTLSAAGVLAMQQLSRVGQVIDRQRWMTGLGAQTVNARYNLTENQVYLLGGLMRPPFLDTVQPAAMNYAGVATVLAHEWVHGFGTSGRYFNGEGTLQNVYGPGRTLWSKASDKAFNANSRCFVAQYAKHEGMLPKTRINGAKTLDENLADNGAVNLAFRTFQQVQATLPPQLPVGTLTPEQLFFVAYTQHFCEAGSADWLKYGYSRSWNRYAPAPLRAILPLRNSPEFAQAFSCPAGSPMGGGGECLAW